MSHELDVVNPAAAMSRDMLTEPTNAQVFATIAKSFGVGVARVLWNLVKIILSPAYSIVGNLYKPFVNTYAVKKIDEVSAELTFMSLLVALLSAIAAWAFNPVGYIVSQVAMGFVAINSGAAVVGACLMVFKKHFHETKSIMMAKQISRQ